MTPKELYLAWVRSKFPLQYTQALRSMLGKPRNLGGLGADLLSSALSPNVMSPFGDDLQEVTVTASPDVVPSFTDPGLQPISMPDVSNIQVTSLPDMPPASTGASDWFTAFTNAVSNVASTYVTASAQNNLLRINTDRAQRGLPPITANGVPVTAASLAPANSSIYALEKRIAGGVTPSTWLLAGLGLVALLMFGRRGRR